jgi:hypothetical protein
MWVEWLISIHCNLPPLACLQIDTLGAKTCQTKEVIVAAPTTAFGTSQLSAALAGVDIDRLAVTGDTSAMVAAALQIASLLDYAATKGISTAADDDASSAGSVAVAHTNNLIATLAATKIEDPDQLANLLSAGAKVSGKAELTSASGRGLMGLFK